MTYNLMYGLAFCYRNENGPLLDGLDGIKDRITNDTIYLHW